MSINFEDESLDSVPQWRDQETLEHLYSERECSIREIADELDCDYSTVRNWLLRFNIDLRPANHEKKHPSVSSNTAGYTYAKSEVDGHRGNVGLHELAAILGGEDPHYVFSPDTDVHHYIRIPSEFDAPQLDLPGNVDVMPTNEHQRRHREGTHDDPDVEEVLVGDI